jgi:hypothetical protein
VGKISKAKKQKKQKKRVGAGEKIKLQKRQPGTAQG